MQQIRYYLVCLLTLIFHCKRFNEGRRPQKARRKSVYISEILAALEGICRPGTNGKRVQVHLKKINYKWHRCACVCLQLC